MESELIHWLGQRLTRGPATKVGVGDDAAILELRRWSATAVTTDALMDGVDFDLQNCGARQAGRKALAVNLSDLAAMAASPQAVLVSLVLPRRGGLALAKELFEGMIPLADRYGVDIVGGDTNSWDGKLVISVTALGATHPSGPWLRSGGRAGDEIVVTGALGGSILGRHLDFEPRVREALALATSYAVSAATDVSDGLTWDLQHILDQSGCGALVDLWRVPISPAARQLAAACPDGPSPLDHALGDGEDFELILALAPTEAQRLLRDQPLDVPLTRIGGLTERPGLWSRNHPDAEVQPLAPRGYQHRFEE